MKLRISINGVDYAAYNLTSLEGTLNVLMKPAAYKKVRSNENASIHGTHMLTAPTARRKAAGTISIPFLITGASSLKDLQRKIDKLVEVLVNGKNNTGINELYCADIDRCFRLRYNDMTSYANFGLDGEAKITIKFDEPNQNNRMP